jgi:hypothetical protein
VIAVVSYLWVRSALNAIARADRAEEIAAPLTPVDTDGTRDDPPEGRGFSPLEGPVSSRTAEF